MGEPISTQHPEVILDPSSGEWLAKLFLGAIVVA
jgi:hypothetical protein